MGKIILRLPMKSEGICLKIVFRFLERESKGERGNAGRALENSEPNKTLFINFFHFQRFMSNFIKIKKAFSKT